MSPKVSMELIKVELPYDSHFMTDLEFYDDENRSFMIYMVLFPILQLVICVVGFIYDGYDLGHRIYCNNTVAQ